MERFSFINELLRGKWLIEEDYVKEISPLLNSIFNKEQFAASADEDKKNSNYFPSVFLSNGEIEVLDGENSINKEGIALINLSGPIMKEDFCGDAGAKTIASYIKQADEFEHIMGIVLKVDSPGGSVHASDLLSTAISNCNKPTIAWIEHGVMASGAMWVGASCDKIYASSKMDYVGSIGVMTSSVDLKPEFERFNRKEIYADQSTEKNLITRELKKGNDAPIKKALTETCDAFISHVRENRSINTEHTDPFKGGIYMAEEAIKIGLIDGIKPFEEVIMEINMMAQGDTSFTI